MEGAVCYASQKHQEIIHSYRTMKKYVSLQNVKYASAPTFIQRIRKKYLSHFRYRLCWKEKYKKLYFRKSYSCYYCKKLFLTEKILASHTRRHTSKEYVKEEPYICPACKRKFMTIRSFTMHIDQHNQKKFFCDNCGKTFSYKCKLNVHVRCHCNNNICNFCNKSLSSNSLQLHIKRNQIACSRKEDTHCSYCGIIVQPRCLLLKHQTDHGKLRQKALLEIKQRLQRHNPLMFHDESYVKCLFCNKVIKNVYAFKHFDSHIITKYKYSLPLFNRSWKLAVMLQFVDKAVEENKIDEPHKTENGTHMNSINLNNPGSSQLLKEDFLQYNSSQGRGQNELQPSSIDMPLPSYEDCSISPSEFLPHSIFSSVVGSSTFTESFDGVNSGSIVSNHDHIKGQAPVSHMVSDATSKEDNLTIGIRPGNITGKEEDDSLVIKTEFIPVKEYSQQLFSDFECLETKQNDIQKDIVMEERDAVSNEELMPTSDSAMSYRKHSGKDGTGDLISLKGPENPVKISKEIPAVSNSKDLINEERVLGMKNDSSFPPESTPKTYENTSKSSKKIFTCRCNIFYSVKFHSKAALINHKKLHNKDKCIRCPKFGKILSLDDFLFHQKICIDECVANFKKHEECYINPETTVGTECNENYCFPCFYCTMCFSRSHNALRHIRKHHKEGLRCPFCQKKYNSFKVFEMHLRYNRDCHQQIQIQRELYNQNAECKHKNNWVKTMKERAIVTDANQTTNDWTKTTKESVIVSDANQTTKDWTKTTKENAIVSDANQTSKVLLLTNEGNKSNSVETTMYIETPTESSLYNDASQRIDFPLSVSQDKEYRCPACRRRYYDREVFALHVVGHERSNWYICPDCSLSFWLKEGLLEHCLFVHPENYGAEEKHQIWRTRFGIHSEVKVLLQRLLKCSDCGEYFGTSQDLQRHITSHER